MDRQTASPWLCSKTYTFCLYTCTNLQYAKEEVKEELPTKAMAMFATQSFFFFLFFLKGKLGVPSQITRAVSKCKYVLSNQQRN